MKKRIEILDQALKDLDNADMSSDFRDAYIYSATSDNELINIYGIILNDGLTPFINDCRKHGITEFTISSTFPHTISLISDFVDIGCKIDGIVKIKSRYKDTFTGKNQLIPAIKMSL